MLRYHGVTPLTQVVKGGYCTGFLTDWNNPQAEGTQPLVWLNALEKEGLQGGEKDKSRVVRHRHIHDPGIQQEPRAKRATGFPDNEDHASERAKTSSHSRA